MNKKQKVRKTILSILSGIFAVLTLFFFVQIIVKANTPLLTTISDNAEESDDTLVSDEIDEDDEDYPDFDYDDEELAENINTYFYDNYKDMVIIYGRKIGVAFCDLNMDDKVEILISNNPEGVDFDCFLGIFSIENNDLNKLDSLTGRFEAYQGDDGVYLVGTNNGESVCYKISTLNNKLSQENISEDDIPSSCYDEPIEFEDYTEEIENYYGSGSNDDDSDSDEISEAYYRYLEEWYDYFTYDGANAEVAFYDINYDGTDEMIVSFGTTLADWTNEIYSITDYSDYNVQQLDTVGSQQSFYEAEDGDGLYLVRGIQGMEIITQLTMNDEGDEVYLDEISNRHIDADEDYYSNDYPLEFQDLDSYLGY